MSNEEYNEMIIKRYKEMGLDVETATRMIDNEVNPVSDCLQQELTKNATSVKAINKSYNFNGLEGVSNFSFKQPKDEASKTSYVEKTRAKKEDILNALFNHLSASKEFINTNTVQLGKAGTIFFKNNSGDYFTLKLTLNKSKPADFIE